MSGTSPEGRGFPDAAGSQPDPVLDQALALLSRRTVLFGHQSVGENLLDGLRLHARARGVALRVVEAGAGGLERGALSHAFLASNGEPLAKLAAFEALLRKPGPDVAALKLCWADFGPGTDPAPILAAHQATFERLRGRFPGTAFLHLTTPLTTVESGLRALAKRLLGRAPWGEQENARREAFNELLRQRTPARELFDLARLEAEDPRGGVAMHPCGGRPVLALAAANTEDGGHLGMAAAARIGRAFAIALASAVRA